MRNSGGLRVGRSAIHVDGRQFPAGAEAFAMNESRNVAAVDASIALQLFLGLLELALDFQVQAMFGRMAIRWPLDHMSILLPGPFAAVSSAEKLAVAPPECGYLRVAVRPSRIFHAG